MSFNARMSDVLFTMSKWKRIIFLACLLSILQLIFDVNLIMIKIKTKIRDLQITLFFSFSFEVVFYVWIIVIIYIHYIWILPLNLNDSLHPNWKLKTSTLEQSVNI